MYVRLAVAGAGPSCAAEPQAAEYVTTRPTSQRPRHTRIITRVSTDLTGVAVALVGVAGTLGATALTQRASARGRQFDAEIQRRDRAEERDQAARTSAQAEKRTIYADLNAAARLYRTVAHDHLLAKRRGIEPTDAEIERLEAARANYRDLYARAQMVLPDRVLAVASEVNLCLGHGYRVLRDIDNGFDNSITIDSLHEWFEGPLSDGVWLLRRALREDLGVVEPSTDLDSAVARLRASRKARFDLWPATAAPPADVTAGHTGAGTLGEPTVTANPS